MAIHNLLTRLENPDTPPDEVWWLAKRVLDEHIFPRIAQPDHQMLSTVEGVLTVLKNGKLAPESFAADLQRLYHNIGTLKTRHREQMTRAHLALLEGLIAAHSYHWTPLLQAEDTRKADTLRFYETLPMNTVNLPQMLTRLRELVTTLPESEDYVRLVRYSVRLMMYHASRIMPPQTQRISAEALHWRDMVVARFDTLHDRLTQGYLAAVLLIVEHEALKPAHLQALLYLFERAPTLLDEELAHDDAIGLSRVDVLIFAMWVLPSAQLVQFIDHESLTMKDRAQLLGTVLGVPVPRPALILGARFGDEKLNPLYCNLLRTLLGSTRFWEHKTNLLGRFLMEDRYISKASLQRIVDELCTRRE